MANAKTKSPPTTTASGYQRLLDYCRINLPGIDVQPLALTPDASVREYYRIPWGPTKAVAAVYPEGFEAATEPFLDITGLFQAAALPVPEIYDVDEQRGIIIQQDLGDLQLFEYNKMASEDESERLLESAINLIARVQSATPLAFERNSVACKLAFDRAKLGWELSFFVEHFFSSLRKEELNKRLEKKIKQELDIIAHELSQRPQVLCHRDFHASNLLVDSRKELCIIDYQDARLGPVSYDLVSLLLDRVTEPPSLARIRAGRLMFLEERRAVGLPEIDVEEFTAEFRLMTIQRVLKAIGTFSFQAGVKGRLETYIKYVNPMLSVALQAAELLGRFPLLQEVLTARKSDSYDRFVKG